MKNITELLTICLISISFSGFSQNETRTEWCGTQFTEEMLDKVQSATERHLNGTLMKSRPTYDIAITLHNMRNTDGTGGVDPIRTLEVFCEVIDFYAQHDINLFIQEMKTHDNTNWTNDPNGNNSWGTIKLSTIGLSGVNNTINIYNFEDLYNEQYEQSLCGYFSPFFDVVAFTGNTSCFTKETIVHELGHYFALPHTFSGFENMDNQCGENVTMGEKVDGSNCATEADRICDTPPDNNPLRLPCPGGNGCKMYDSDGVEFFPDVTNIMSYFADNCMNKFTEGQRAVMHNKIDEDRQDLLVLPAPSNVEPVAQAVELNSPLDTEKPYNQVLFNWEPVPNASLYYFEINRVGTFSPPLRIVTTFTEETQYISYELDPSSTYHWRVVAFNKGNPCGAEQTETRGSFETSDQMVAVEDVEGLEAFELMPNPVANNQAVAISLTSKKAMNGQLQLYNVAGQRIYSEAIQVAASDNTFNLNIEGLAAGLYVVRLEFAEGAVQQKLIIQ